LESVTEGLGLGFVEGNCVGVLLNVGSTEGRAVGKDDGVIVGVTEVVGLMEGAILTYDLQ
jgi:hypothetical protein